MSNKDKESFSSDHLIIRSSDHPTHVAVIMDGNGRWAQARGLPRTAGHKQGAEAVRRIVEAASDFQIPYLTLFGFSSENWNRPKTEIQELMKLLRYYLRAETAELHKRNVRLRVIGRRQDFDQDIIEMIETAENLTHDNTAINLTIALNYGGRDDIAHAFEKIFQNPEQINADIKTEDLITKNLMTADLPDPDLLIRTSGEKRISNFLLWQCAYTEMVFTPVLWPDFSKSDLERALNEYASRERRFGAVRQSEA